MEETYSMYRALAHSHRIRLLGLIWDCVNFENGTITINKQLQINPKTKERELTTTKSDKARTITPAPMIMQLLKKHSIRQTEAKQQAGPAWQESNLVFTNENGRYIIPQVLFYNLKAIAKKIGRPDLRFHDLRHSYAVASLRSGDDVKTLQENLGHADATMTLNVYAHVTEQMKQASAARMDSYIKGVLNL